MIGLKNAGRAVLMGVKLHGLAKSIGHKGASMKNQRYSSENTINQLVSDANQRYPQGKPIESNNSNSTNNEFLPMGLHGRKIKSKNSYLEK